LSGEKEFERVDKARSGKVLMKCREGKNEVVVIIFKKQTSREYWLLCQKHQISKEKSSKHHQFFEF
jgi:hypothetical protein